uniref:Vesicle transport protein n=1 Tax=Caenorhabditis tropicalis TaxID=1561998 RepID=A0A1I7U9L5_9PELO
MSEPEKKVPSDNQPKVFCCKVRTILILLSIFGLTSSITFTVLSEHYRVIAGFTITFYLMVLIGAFFHIKLCLSAAQKLNIACQVMHFALSMTTYGWRLYFELILAGAAIKVFEFIMVRRLGIYISSVKNVGKVHPPV